MTSLKISIPKRENFGPLHPQLVHDSPKWGPKAEVTRIDLTNYRGGFVHRFAYHTENCVHAPGNDCLMKVQNSHKQSLGNQAL